MVGRGTAEARHHRREARGLLERRDREGEGELGGVGVGDDEAAVGVEARADIKVRAAREAADAVPSYNFV